ncbi:MAG: FAD-dependent oxidoreductase [Elainellaceae cyanobacterium]
MIDIAIVGAGLTGLTCAQLLRGWGYTVAVFDKSRGLGGRVATRRVGQTCFDHGARCLSQQGSQTQQLIDTLLNGEQSAQPPQFLTNQTSEPIEPPVLVPWPRSPHQLHSSEDNQPLTSDPHESSQSYVPIAGMTAIAKFLSNGLDIRRQHRVTGLDANLTSHCWELKTDEPSQTIEPARAVILTLPAPQAVPLLEPLATVGLESPWIEQVRAVEFAPCFSVIGGYSAHTLPLQADPQTGLPLWSMGDRQWDALRCANDEMLAWIGVDSSKSRDAGEPIMVFQSTDTFAAAHADDLDVEAVGDRILKRAAHLLNCPALCDPQWRQVQRWRYAFCCKPLTNATPYLVTQHPLLLGCAGDWCSGSQLEDALHSGRAIANHFHQALKQAE